MSVTQIIYECGNPHSPYVGRVSLHLHYDERFEAAYEHRRTRTAWQGMLRQGTFSRACIALANAGFPSVPPLGELAPGEAPKEFAWYTDGAWQRGELRETDRRFAAFVIITSTILTVLDPKLARMPPGETTPVVDASRV